MRYNMDYFNKNWTLLEIVNAYPETIPVFSSNGFPQMSDEEKRNKFAASINLKTALLLKQLDYDTFRDLLIEAIESSKNSIDETLTDSKVKNSERTINISGLLPCPVRIPLLQEFTKFSKSYEEQSDYTLNYELKAASMGLDWLEENLTDVESEDDLPDLFLSAGFDMFFDEKRFGKFKRDGVFKDCTAFNNPNELFIDLNLTDPRGHYGIISVVPAVFLINKDELGDLEVPTSWKDILKPEFENRVSLPVGDFDLFNGILLNIHKKYGDNGVRKLGKSLLESMHPSQMVKSDRKKTAKPIVTIMPYFFTKMVKEGGPLSAIWPEDGAIISPIFILSKAKKARRLQPVVDFFSSMKVGKVLSHQGLFPSVHPDIDNHIPETNKFMWLGWDYIYNNNISELIAHCNRIFTEATESGRNQ